MNNYKGGLQIGTRDKSRVAGVSKNPGILWLGGEDRNKLAVIAITLEHVLKRQGYLVSLLDQDQINYGLCAGLGNSKTDRREYIRRVAETCKILDETGLVTIVLVDVVAQDEWDFAAEILEFSRFSTVYIESQKLWQSDSGDSQSTHGNQAVLKPESPALHIQSDDKRIEDVINLLLVHLKERGSLSNGFTPLGGGVTTSKSHDLADGEIQIAVAAG